MDAAVLRNPLAMTCPVCHIALQMTTRQSIEIDYCPQCRGLWLDRGELDKIIEREASRPLRDDVYDAGAPRVARRSDDDDDDDERRGGGYDPRRKKRKGLLGELFDFD